MADERLNESGYTQFGSTPPTYGNWFYPLGPFGRFLSKFFSRKGAEELVRQERNPSEPTTPPPDVGDTLVSTNLPVQGGGFGRQSGAIVLTEVEQNRKSRYRTFENMDSYPEISCAFDIYADDSTQRSLEGDRWVIETDDETAKKEVLKCFKAIRLKNYIWDIVRNCCKYGDNFLEPVTNLNKPKEGIKRIKILDPTYIIRRENEYGYLEGFYQQIPKGGDWGSMGSQSDWSKKEEFVPLDKNQIIHFKLETSDPTYYPYGKSIAAAAQQTYRSLKMMEDAMLIYRLSRAPERRIFYVDTGNLPSSKAEAFMERLKERLKKEKYVNRNTQNIDARYNPMSIEEDFYIPLNNANSKTKVETLPGAQNLGEVDDVRYFRDKLLATLKVPKDFIVEKDKSPERKANLSQLDVKFAKVIVRVQESISLGLTQLAQLHLSLKGFRPAVIKNLEVSLPEPSDMFIKRKMDVDEQRARVIQAYTGLNILSQEYLLKQYFDFTDSEIEEIKRQRKKEMKEMEAMMPQDPGMGGAPPGMQPPMDPGQELGLDQTNFAGQTVQDQNPTEDGRMQDHKLYPLYKQYLAEGNQSRAEQILYAIKNFQRV